ncbi:prostate-associated microseminoprotein-like isoform X1 [Engraulis encrasicolus]|uniref:prostate-associated microseminoprotein-like isoform X1 n=1 Tax=Engraulis encrasicolus TaxID=184585 RepID=UPI002FD32E89
MRCLVLALLLCSLAAFANAACYQTMKKPSIVKGNNGQLLIKDPAQDPCQDDTDKDWHEVGSSWTNSQCMECSCGTGGMGCCDRMGRPFGFPEDCEVLYDWKQCNYEVVKKNDHSVYCPHGAVGK